MKSNTEVLDLVEYLLAKTTQGSRDHEEGLRSDISLTVALRGMEDEASPRYTKADLKVRFSGSKRDRSSCFDFHKLTWKRGGYAPRSCTASYRGTTTTGGFTWSLR
jgi:hypothetical protein